jgi:outer membrane protein TolC
MWSSGECSNNWPWRGIRLRRKARVQNSRARFAAGLTSALDVAQAEAQLATTQSQVPSLQSAARQAVHQLGVLLGQAPETLVDESAERPIPTIPAEVTVGLPSELLRRRPDVRRAEQDLAAATARISVEPLLVGWSDNNLAHIRRRTHPRHY